MIKSNILYIIKYAVICIKFENVSSKILDI